MNVKQFLSQKYIVKKLGKHFIYGRCHEKTFCVPNYVFFTLLHEWVDRGQTHQLEKLLHV